MRGEVSKRLDVEEACLEERVKFVKGTKGEARSYPTTGLNNLRRLHLMRRPKLTFAGNDDVICNHICDVTERAGLHVDRAALGEQECGSVAFASHPIQRSLEGTKGLNDLFPRVDELV
jgi:hypothetical protein